MDNKKRWSQKEIDLLKETVRIYSYNRQEAFRIVSEKTGRTVKSVNLKWYKDVKHSPSKCFTSIGGDGKIIVNGTSYTPSRKSKGTKPVSKSFREIVKLIKELLNPFKL